MKGVRTALTRGAEPVRPPLAEVRKFADLERWLDEHRVTEVECLVPDLTAWRAARSCHGKTASQKNVACECRKCMVRSPSPVSRPVKVLLRCHPAHRPRHASGPDPSTVRIVPWATDPTAQVIHDCYDKDGAHRSVRAAVGASAGLRGCTTRAGWPPVVAPELEFYLVARNDGCGHTAQAPVGRSGRPETSRQSYSIDAVNEFDPLFEDVYAYCEEDAVERRHLDP